MSDRSLALVLHTHMPYVEGYGTWPFGEEWLWEAIATSYLPLLDLLGAVTLSLTPVLCDQLAVDDLAPRLERFLIDVRRATHAADAADLDARGERAAAAELRRAAGDYERALERLHELDGDLLGALRPDWTSAATHAVLPLLATDAGVRLQVRAGVRSHRARFGDGWRGGFWLPECAYAPWLDELLTGAGVRRCCVEAPLAGPIVTPAGLHLVPIDRSIIDLVWGGGGYPSHAAYRDSHRRTAHDHQAWANDGAVYDPERAAATVREHARDFVARVGERGGLVVCALDTELLGHWWYEGVRWLAAVIDEATRRGLPLVKLDDVEITPAAAETPAPSTWGEGRDLRTWDSPAVADLVWLARAAELRAVRGGVDDAGARQLAALQSSDWAFQVSRRLAVSYGRERAAGHAHALARADGGSPRGLGPHVSAALLRG